MRPRRWALKRSRRAQSWAATKTRHDVMWLQRQFHVCHVLQLLLFHVPIVVLRVASVLLHVSRTPSSEAAVVFTRLARVNGSVSTVSMARGPGDMALSDVALRHPRFAIKRKLQAKASSELFRLISVSHFCLIRLIHEGLKPRIC